MYLDLSDDGLSKTIFYRGVHEPLVTRWLEAELAPGMTVLEVGANLGYYLLLAATRIGPRGRIYAVEPVPETFAILRKNVLAPAGREIIEHRDPRVAREQRFDQMTADEPGATGHQEPPPVHGAHHRMP